MRIRLRRRSALDERLDRVFRRYREGCKQPSMEQLKADLSIERLLAHSLGREPEPVRSEPRWCCPFHADTNPSLWARDEKRRWGCNPCGISGDIFDWVCRFHVLPLKGAVLYLRRHVEDFRL